MTLSKRGLKDVSTPVIKLGPCKTQFRSQKPPTDALGGHVSPVALFGTVMSICLYCSRDVESGALAHQEIASYDRCEHSLGMAVGACASCPAGFCRTSRIARCCSTSAWPERFRRKWVSRYGSQRNIPRPSFCFISVSRFVGGSSQLMGCMGESVVPHGGTRERSSHDECDLARI